MYARTKQLPFLVQTPEKHNFSAFAQTHGTSDAQNIDHSIYIFLDADNIAFLLNHSFLIVVVQFKYALCLWRFSENEEAGNLTSASAAFSP